MSEVTEPIAASGETLPAFAVGECFFGIFYRPSVIMASFRERPRWVIVFALALVVSYLAICTESYYLNSTKSPVAIGPSGLDSLRLAPSTDHVVYPAKAGSLQQDRADLFSSRPWLMKDLRLRIIAGNGAVWALGSTAEMLVIGLIMFLLGGLLRARARYWSFVSLAVHSTVPMIPFQLLQSLIWIFVPPPFADLNSPAAPLVTMFISMFMAGLWGVWVLVVFVIGVRQVTRGKWYQVVGIAVLSTVVMQLYEMTLHNNWETLLRSIFMPG